MKILFIALLAFFFAAEGMAAKELNVSNTPHNLGSTQPSALLNDAYSAWNEDEVCVFCHTPHGGTLAGPLWNRDVSGISGSSYYTHYKSAKLTDAEIPDVRAVSDESLLCLSCHDGSIGVGDSLINNSPVAPDNTGSGFKIILSPDGINPGKRIGASRDNLNSTVDLSDDHPISFSYQDLLSAGIPDLHTINDAEADGLVFFGSTKRVECSSCHDPHVDSSVDNDYKPFLRIPNTNSDMCLGCHIK